MPREQAVLWMGVLILVMLSFILGQIASASIAAMVAVYLVYLEVQERKPRGATRKISIRDLA